MKPDTFRYVDYPLAGDVGSLTITGLDPAREYMYGQISCSGTRPAHGCGAPGTYTGSQSRSPRIPSQGR